MTPSLNMLTDPVFPVVSQAGQRRWVTFSGLLREDDDPPVSFNWPRADLNIASAELAIGLLCLIHRPTSHKDWEDLWNADDDAGLEGRIAALAPYFNLFGDAEGRGPRFCQDFEPIKGEINAVEALFIDAPGLNGQKKNADLMTHRGRYPALGLRAAALTLYALQQFAPTGGAGHRTSLRGGGPMTTLVMPLQGGEQPVALRRLLLANMPVLFEEDWLEDDELGRALPWIGPTITSEGTPARDVAETCKEVHPVQSLFGMPRRIRLLADGHGTCSLTGDEGPLIVGFMQKPWGMNYSAWRHPLTPYRQKKEEQPYTVKPKSVFLGYRDWVGITVGRRTDADKAFPALVISAAERRMSQFRKLGLTARMLAAGWSMNNMEAESFLHSVQPLYLAPEDRKDIALRIADLADRFAQAGDDAARLLRSALNDALFGGKSKATDTSLFEEATDAFFGSTEDDFHAALSRVAAGEWAREQEDDGLQRGWLKRLRDVALSIFDSHASNLLGGTPDVRLAARIAAAYGKLSRDLSATSSLAKKLGVLQPVTNSKRVASKRKTAKEG